MTPRLSHPAAGTISLLLMLVLLPGLVVSDNSPVVCPYPCSLPTPPGGGGSSAGYPPPGYSGGSGSGGNYYPPPGYPGGGGSGGYYPPPNPPAVGGGGAGNVPYFPPKFGPGGGPGQVPQPPNKIMPYFPYFFRNGNAATSLQPPVAGVVAVLSAMFLVFRRL